MIGSSLDSESMGVRHFALRKERLDQFFVWTFAGLNLLSSYFVCDYLIFQILIDLILRLYIGSRATVGPFVVGFDQLLGVTRVFLDASAVSFVLVLHQYFTLSNVQTKLRLDMVGFVSSFHYVSQVFGVALTLVGSLVLRRLHVVQRFRAGLV